MAAVLVATATSLAWTQLPRPPALVLRGGTLWDGSGRPPVADAVVVIRGERVACAGASGACAAPPEARVVHVDGGWILPGLVDTHVHLGDADRAGREQALRFAAGITAVREASTVGALRRNLRARAAAAEARAPMPRLFVSGRVSPRLVAERGERDARALTRRLLHLGVDGIKVKGDLEDEIAAVVEEAHAAGRPVFGHTGMYGPRRRSYTAAAVRARLDGVVHMDDIGLAVRALDPAAERAMLARLAPERSRVDTAFSWSASDRAKEDALIALMVERGAWLEPTLLGLHLTLEPERVAGIPAPAAALEPRARARARAGLARMRAFVRRFHEAGGVVVAGTDGPFAPERDLVEELRLLEASGLPPAAVLAAATRDAARALGWEDRVGTVAPGRLADLLVLDADPLAAAANLRRVWLVVKGGVVHAPRGGTTSPRVATLPSRS